MSIAAFPSAFYKLIVAHGTHITFFSFLTNGGPQKELEPRCCSTLNAALCTVKITRTMYSLDLWENPGVVGRDEGVGVPHFSIGNGHTNVWF